MSDEIQIPEAVQSEIRSAISSMEEISKAIERLQHQAEGVNAHINRRVIEILGIEQGGSYDPQKMVYRKSAPEKAL